MRKTMLFAIGAALLAGCSDPTEKGADAGRSPDGAFSVKEARCVFDEVLGSHVRSRADAGLPDAGFFRPGEVEPVWDEAREVESEEFLRVDVPVETTYDFVRLVPDEETCGLNPVVVPRTLVVLKDPDSDRQSVYFCFYIADDDFAEWYAARPRQEWIDGDAKNYFSGIVLYTTLSGHIAAAGRCDHGRMEEGVFLGDPTLDRSAAMRDVCNMLQLMYFGRGVRSSATRSDIAYCLDIDAVACIAPRPDKKEPFADWTIEIKRTELPPFKPRGGGGGGGGASGLNIRSLWNNNRILYTGSGIEDILDDLAADCMGDKLINSIDVDIQIWKSFEIGCKTEMHSTNLSLNNEPAYAFFQYFRIYLGTTFRDVSLFEELIHVYQYSGEPNMKKDRMNREIEAKLGWFMYRQRINDLTKIASALGGDEGVDIFKELSKYYRDKDFKSEDFYKCYEDAASSLRNLDGYSDETAYPLNPEARNFPNLEKLMKDC